MPTITIHTATYNRAYILSKAYDSLLSQTCKDFEWIITDDGSTDDTESLVSSWLSNDNGFKIIYSKLEHVGIPRALNHGIRKANTEWFMMLDSDDYILPETINKVKEWIKEIKDIKNMAGVAFCRCFPDGNFMKPQMPIINPQIGYVDATHIERSKYNLDMDCCEVHRTSILLKYPFLYWPTEKYAPEQLSFFNMAFDGYKLRWRNEKLYICEYLPDGQTKDNRLVMNNPMGFAMMYNQNIKRFKSFKAKCYNAIQMTALSLYAKKPRYLKSSNNIFITVLTFPLGATLGMRRYIQFSKLKKAMR